MVGRSFAARALAGGPWAKARWLVLAPHPDDETLGAGALISEAASHGALAGVVYLTDGSGSHRHVDVLSRQRLIATRRREASLALRRLAGPRCSAPLFLDWPDAAPSEPNSPVFSDACRRLAAICRARRVDAMAVTAIHEPHCDHAAACRLAYAVSDCVRRPLVVFEYVVWADRAPGPAYRAIRTAPMLVGRRRAALSAHRSQLSPLLGDGFRLSARQLRMAPFDLLYTQGSNHAA
jgi:LmbE family N-acetylglucosaminyl deacetylase